MRLNGILPFEKGGPQRLPAGAARLSLVVPVYNVAPYLAKCLDSLLGQSRPVEQIIVVDDGSTDECPDILRRYAAAHPNIVVIRQENQGLSMARNAGLAQVTGDYVAFVDSDDFAAPDCYENWLALAVQHDVDMVAGNGWYHFEGRAADYPIYRDEPTPGVSVPGESAASPPSAGVTSGAAWLAGRLARRSLLHMVWLHLYRTGFLREHAFAFVPRLIHEDVIWTSRVLLAAQRIVSDPQPRYFYRIRVRRFDPAQNDSRLAAIVASSVTNACALADIAEREVADERLRALIRWQLVDGGLAVFHKLDKFSTKEQRRRVRRELRRSGYLALLWRNAGEFRQRRRIARNYLRSLLAELGGR
jgi:glycosyltransferase involved in cell wall biosynthesis